MKSDANAFARNTAGRKLIAIVYADVAGFSRLMGFEDAQTIKRLRLLRRALIDPAIKQYGGRIVKTGGDSLLVVFESIYGAVLCALKIQQEMPIYDGDRHADRAIRFRIGINIGDAIAEGTDYLGDGINVAARLQAECPVGEICVSRAVRDHVHAQLNLEFRELGTLTLKNILRPVEAYVLRSNVQDRNRFVEDDGKRRPSVEVKKGLAGLWRIADTELGILAQCVLVIEMVLGVLLVFSGSVERALLAQLMVMPIVLLAGVFGLAIWLRPEKFAFGPEDQEARRHHILVKVFDKSNDFLATGDKYQLPSLISGAKSEIWFFGTTFYITIGQYRDLLLSKLADGVDVNFIVLDPNGEAVSSMARLLGVTVEELKLDCMSGIRVMMRTADDVEHAKARGKLRIKLIDEPFQTRFYIVDPRSKGGYMYYIPQVNGINSQTVPGFLIRTTSSKYHQRYFDGLLKTWNDPNSISLEDWKLAELKIR